MGRISALRLILVVAGSLMAGCTDQRLMPPIEEERLVQDSGFSLFLSPQEVFLELGNAHGDVHQTLFDAERADVAVTLRMRQGFVDVKELNAFIFVIEFDRLPTGDVTHIRGSREAAERQHRVGALAG